MVAVFLQPGEDDGFDVVLPIGAGTKDDLTKATAHHVPIPFGSSNCNLPDCIGLLASKTEDCLSLVCRVHQVAVAAQWLSHMDILQAKGSCADLREV